MLRFFTILVCLLLIGGAGVAGGGIWVFYEYGKGLPDHRQLKDYEPPVMTRVHAGDGRLLAEYAIEKRVFVPIRAMPPRLVNAFIAAEDQNFFIHKGIDPQGVLRAVLVNIKNYGTGRRLVGASTITQQVAKNFLLTNEVSIDRKIKEAILALRLEKTLEKERILELYLNEIYLGFQSYGVAAAALNYFDKSLNELTISEVAYLAALPKAPNNYHPVNKYQAAVSRRDWVVGRMLEEGFISQSEADAARATPLTTRERRETELVEADYFAEEVRRELLDLYGEDWLYKGGLSVHTTVDPRLQEIADRVLRKGLETYDFRHGWRGPLATVPTGADWRTAIEAFEPPPGMFDRVAGIVVRMDAKGVDLLIQGGGTGYMPLEQMRWARPWLEDQKVGGAVSKPSDVVSIGDIVSLRPETHRPARDGEEPEAYPPDTYGLSQIPDIEGALVALDPHTGRVLAMSGGYSPDRSEFNRVTQAWRQPGSSFKPFVYLAALDNGYTPSTRILDAPFVIDQGPGQPKWRPANYTEKFYGPSTMRLGIEKSRNLMTVRLAQAVGMDTIADYSQKFGIVDNLEEVLSMSLGAGETTLMRLTSAYAMLVNGGKEITPTLIDRIQNRNGLTVFRHDTRECDACRQSFWTSQPVPILPDTRTRLADAGSAYQIVSMLEGVVERGTGRRISAVGKPLAGKTGTTNNQVDTWFVGFSPDLAVGVFIGFDKPRGLGKKETGSSVPAPVFRDFMAEALAGKPGIPFRIPPGLRLVRIDPATGALADPGDPNVILEAFKPDTVPTGDSLVVAGDGHTPGYDSGVGGVGSPSIGTGGLY